MLLKRRPPALDSQPVTTADGYGHLDRKAVAMLRWLQANGVEFVLVGSVAEAIRGGARVPGPVVIVPAPYARNFERLSRALWSAHAMLIDGDGGTVPVKINEAKLTRGERWSLRCGIYDLEIESDRPEAPRYQELLYEAARFKLAPDLAVEVASPEDIEHYVHVNRTGTAPEIRISRNSREQKPA